jgi:ArsR family transcriptional regulator
MNPSKMKLGEYLQAISPQPRLEILLTMGTGEACVCHLEARLGYRQAYISQHLMALREAGVITARREGRYIYYRLINYKLLELIELAAGLSGVDETGLTGMRHSAPVECVCPKCTGDPAIPVLEAGMINET